MQAWSEMLTHDGPRRRAVEGFEVVRRRIAEVIRRDQAAGTVPAELEPGQGGRG